VRKSTGVTLITWQHYVRCCVGAQATNWRCRLSGVYWHGNPLIGRNSISCSSQNQRNLMTCQNPQQSPGGGGVALLNGEVADCIEYLLFPVSDFYTRLQPAKTRRPVARLIAQTTQSIWSTLVLVGGHVENNALFWLIYPQTPLFRAGVAKIPL
jgi:hypothetical protein